MTAKENALRIIRFNKPERVVSAIPCHDISYFGVDHEGFEGGSHNVPVGTRWTDIWGIGWQKELEGIMGFPVRHPLADPSVLGSYSWPDPDDERIVKRTYERASLFDRNADLFLCGRHRETLWERSYNLVGMENLMVLFYTDPGFVREVLRHVMEFQLGMARHYLKLGVEMVHLGDDLGTQNGPLLGPKLVEEFLVPEYRRLFDLYRKNKVLITFHSCGKVDSVIETFIELGVNVLNPVQATANDLPALRKRAGKRLAFQGGVSTAVVMDGPAERIRAEVKKRIHELGGEGGYSCAPDQGMPFPEAHKKAFDDAVEDFGSY